MPKSFRLPPGAEEEGLGAGATETATFLFTTRTSIPPKPSFTRLVNDAESKAEPITIHPPAPPPAYGCMNT